MKRSHVLSMLLIFSCCFLLLTACTEDPGAEELPEAETMQDTIENLYIFVDHRVVNVASTNTYIFDFEEDWTTLRDDPQLAVLPGNLFTTADGKLAAAANLWDSLGFAQPLSGANGYRIEVDLAVPDPRDEGNASALGFGARVNNAVHLFIDSGLWFMIRDNQVLVYLAKVSTDILLTELPLDFSQERTFVLTDNGDQILLSATDDDGQLIKLLAANFLPDGSLSIVNNIGGIVGTIDQHGLADSGFVRIMPHYASATIDNFKVFNMLVDAEDADEMMAFKPERDYAFRNQAKLDLSREHKSPTNLHNDELYVPAELLSKIFRSKYIQEGYDGHLNDSETELLFRVDDPIVRINGAVRTLEKAPYFENGSVYLPIHLVAESFQFYVQHSDSVWLVVNKEELLHDESILFYEERFALYDDVVFAHRDHLELDVSPAGAELYEPVPFDERFVGIAYTTWHRPGTWGENMTWSIPMNGEYFSNDRATIRQHGEWLADAGVDFVFVDWSNNVDYDPITMANSRPDFRMIETSTELLFEEWRSIDNAPKIVLFIGHPAPEQRTASTDGRLQKKADQVWETFAENPAYREMLLDYIGKPLLIVYAGTPAHYQSSTFPWDDERFTVRWMTGFVTEQPPLRDHNTLISKAYWSWEDRGAQTFTVHDKRPEAMTVVASWREQSGTYIAPGTRNNGRTFMEQWARASLIGPKFALVVSWNEWTLGESVDEHISKDIEPSVAHGTFYLDLMREEIAWFKGQR